jgi:hypothetical protein
MLPATESDLTPTARFRETIVDFSPSSYGERCCFNQTFVAKELKLFFLSGIAPKQVAIGIDQLENLRHTDKLNRFIKSSAEESVLSKTFVIMVITRDPSYARGLVGGLEVSTVVTSCNNDIALAFIWCWQQKILAYQLF